MLLWCLFLGVLFEIVWSRLRGDEPYDVLQRLFMDALPVDAALYNDYHAQIVLLAKDVCRQRPDCLACPLEDGCPRVGLERSAKRQKTLNRRGLEAR